jgi:hypothetical protein
MAPLLSAVAGIFVAKTSDLIARASKTVGSEG